jgi:hypothetical protein
MVYPALLPLMLTPQLPAVDCTDAPADLNGLVRFAERRNVVSARVASHFKRSVICHSVGYLFVYSVLRVSQRVLGLRVVYLRKSVVILFRFARSHALCSY